jgi:hypothetical protein
MSQTQESGISVCLKTPKLGTLLFFIVFVLAVPVLLVSSGSASLLKYYLPFVVMLASTITTAGYPDSNQDLYPMYPTTIMGFLSQNLINLVALVGIMWQAIEVGLITRELETGVIVGTVMMIITFPVATQAIPFFIRSGDVFLNRYTNLKYPGNWHRYFLGFFMIITLLGLEMVLIDVLTDEI